MVTGAAGGIGGALAVRLARDGCDVSIADLRPADAVAAAVREHGRRAYAAPCDLADPDAIARFAASVLERFGRCDVLVNCAAHLQMAPLGELDLATWRRFAAVNVDAAFLLVQAFAPGMIERGFGRIVNIVSNTVWAPPGPGMLAYVTSKGALVGFTRALAVELGAHGITVNAVAPGLTRTATAAADMGDAAFEAVRAQQAIGRTLVPDDLAGAVAFLASDDAALITEQAIRVDGGLVTL